LWNLSPGPLDRRGASFETPAPRAPQDDGLYLNAIKDSRHPEEARSAVSKDAYFFIQHLFSPRFFEASKSRSYPHLE
jgi:hypothetical protein